MRLVEEYPKDPFLSKFVDRYQLFVFNEPTYFKTVPNGKIECYFILDGAFERWSKEENTFVISRDKGFYPMTNQMTFFQIPSELICINIKLNLNILSLKGFQDFLNDWQTRSIDAFIKTEDQSKILRAVNREKLSISIETIDEVLSRSISRDTYFQELDKLIDLIENEFTQGFKTMWLADKMNLSSKTLERLVRKHFNLSPKELWQILRFENTTSYLKKNDSQRFIEALSFGYYDQSHFIKECKKITGLTPKDFFSKLKLSTNDLFFDNIN